VVHVAKIVERVVEIAGRQVQMGKTSSSTVARMIQKAVGLFMIFGMLMMVKYLLSWA